MLLYLGGIVILSVVGSSISCPPSCPPGTRCSSETDRGCVRCRPGTYQNGENNSTQCIDCRATCGQKEVIAKNCTSLADMVCQCIDGYHPDRYHTCVPHSECPPGHGVHTNGSSAHDTVCQACEGESFSTNTSSTEPCLPCTRCSEGKETQGNCTPTSDRQCKVTDCGPVANTENGVVNTSSGTTFSKIASFSCNDGYYLSGAPTITCESSGNWSNGPPQCVAVPRALPLDCDPCPKACVVAWIIVVLLTVAVVGVVLLYRRRNQSSQSNGRDTSQGDAYTQTLSVNPVDTAEQVPPRNAPDVDDGYDYAPSNGRDISQGDTNNQTLPMNPVDTAEQLPPRNAPDVDDGYDYAPSNGRDISQVDMNTPLLSNLPQPNIPTNKSIVGLNGENMK